MKSDNQMGSITVDLFLKNIKNFPAITAAFDMLEISYFSQNSFYQIINKAKIQFFDEIKPSLDFIAFINEGNFTSPPKFDCDKLFLIGKTIDSFDSSADELLKITKQKIDEIIDFIASIRDNFSTIIFPEIHKEKIRTEILIVKYELSL